MTQDHPKDQNQEKEVKKPVEALARAESPPKIHVSKALAKVYKKAAQIADLMTGEDVEADLKVLRDAKKACHQVYDTKKKKLVKVPDHKTRLAATTLSRAYHEGKPIERKEVLTGDIESFPDLVARLKNSPAFLSLGNSIQKPVESIPGPLSETQ
jgi:hypothetical protein